MAEFNDHPTELLREWDANEQLRRTHEAYEALTASEVLRVEPMPNQAPTPPEVARLDRAFAVLPFVVLALVLALLLAGCKSDGDRIKAQRNAQYAALATADAPPPTSAPQGIDAAATVNAAVCVHNSSVTKDSTVEGCR